MVMPMVMVCRDGKGDDDSNCDGARAGHGHAFWDVVVPMAGDAGDGDSDYGEHGDDDEQRNVESTRNAMYASNAKGESLLWVQKEAGMTMNMLT